MQIRSSLRQIASHPIVASLKLLARRGLTTRSTGHFAAVQFWAQEPSPKSAHRKVPVSSNVRRQKATLPAARSQ